MAEQEEDKPGIVRALADSLWFPAVFFFGFLLCYVLPFHSPSPHDVRVAVADRAVAAQVGPALDRAVPGGYDVVPADDAASARKKVLDRDTVAAYAVQDGEATLFLAKADGALLETLLTQTFTPIAQQAGHRLTTTEIVPTESGDATGTGLFYLGMVLNIVPYISVMMLLRAVGFGRRAKLIILAILGAVISVGGYYFVLALDIVPNEPIAMLYGFLVTQAVAWTVYGLVPFVRQYIPGVAILLFVMLSIPSSGGAVPYQLVPGFFRWLHPVMPLGNLLDALHGVFYFDGKGLLRPTLVICAWLVVGAALIAAGALLQRRKARAEEGEDEEYTTETEEDVVEDPLFETPIPRGVRPSGGHYGELTPMIHGRVTADTGEPVAHTTVTVTDLHGRQLLHTTADENGEYGITGLPEDPLVLLLFAPGRFPATAHVLPREGEMRRKDFMLPARPPRPAR